MAIKEIELAENWAMLTDSDLSALRFRLLGKKIAELESAIRNLHKVRGRHHTQQACEALFALVGLENKIGAQNG